MAVGAHLPVAAAAAPSAVGGRAASLARRHALSAGKSALPPAVERVRNGERSASLPPASGSVHPVASAAPAALPIAVSAANHAPVALPSGAECTGDSCRAQARARRALLAIRGRGSAPPALPSRAPREGRLNYAPKVVESVTHARQTVTGLRIGAGSQVTGFEAGVSLPVSGTQYIGADGGSPVRGGGPKVGLARTAHGVVVSGTLVRSRVAVTGDEAGSAVTITGEAEQRPEDDLTERSDAAAHSDSQFQRQVDPHGHSVFGTNLGRSIRHAGSRDRRREAPLESTEAGLAITGSALGRASRVTGDEDGACRQVTGDQYLSPSRAQTECGGKGGGTAPAAQSANFRRDPVTGAKVSVAMTWGRQRITGPDVEHDARVTGDAPGSCAVLTGTPYQGPRTLVGWCDPAAAETAQQRLVHRLPASAVTGDTPMHAAQVTGTARGAARAITGTPYYREPMVAAPAEDPVGTIDARFSVHSPQRTAHLSAHRAAAEQPDAVGRITGSCTAGSGKITGNLEFGFKPRRSADGEAKPAHTLLTGEGRTAGRRISGDAWSKNGNVTGTDGFTALERNPSERDGKPHTFAGAQKFRSLAVKEDPKQLVTGMFGWSSKTAAKVTLSGGAHG